MVENYRKKIKKSRQDDFLNRHLIHRLTIVSHPFFDTHAHIDPDIKFNSLEHPRVVKVHTVKTGKRIYEIWNQLYSGEC